MCTGQKDMKNYWLPQIPGLLLLHRGDFASICSKEACNIFSRLTAQKRCNCTVYTRAWLEAAPDVAVEPDCASGLSELQYEMRACVGRWSYAVPRGYSRAAPTTPGSDSIRHRLSRQTTMLSLN
jgi:hypothetical protein